MTSRGPIKCGFHGPSESPPPPLIMGPAVPPSLPGPAVLWGSTCLNIAICVKPPGGALLAHAKTFSRNVYKKSITLVVYGEENWCLETEVRERLFASCDF